MKKKIIFLMLTAASIVANANVRTYADCKVKKVFDENIFEESLSKEEYSSIVIKLVDNKFEVELGANRYSEEKGDRIVNLTDGSSHSLLFQIEPKNSESDVILIEVSSRKKKKIHVLSYMGQKRNETGTIHIVSRDANADDISKEVASMDCWSN